mmetsp:Transcript_56305/g.123317  ORF Transcript_56305/g.123317 Transcript_56305/m.123317 type:complete len:233 (-) Transcript_56305:439-1137(-)
MCQWGRQDAVLRSCLLVLAMVWRSCKLCIGFETYCPRLLADSSRPRSRLPRPPIGRIILPRCQPNARQVITGIGWLNQATASSPLSPRSCSTQMVRKLLWISSSGALTSALLVMVPPDKRMETASEERRGRSARLIRFYGSIKKNPRRTSISSTPLGSPCSATAVKVKFIARLLTNPDFPTLTKWKDLGQPRWMCCIQLSHGVYPRIYTTGLMRDSFCLWRARLWSLMKHWS